MTMEASAMNQKLSLEIYQKALACGFENCGIIPIAELDGYKNLLSASDEELRKKQFPKPMTM